jgi:hypothetical protein
VDYEVNSIRFRNLVVFSGQGLGKTQLVRAMLEKVVEFYGEENVNGIFDGGHIQWMLDYGLDKRVVQFLFCDDLTMVEVPKEELRKWFQIRHHWKRVSGRDTGYIISVLACHRFYSLERALRGNIDCVIARNDTIDPYDHGVLKRFIGDGGIEDLKEIELMREEDPTYMSYSIFNNRFSKGILNLPMAKKDYFTELGVPLYEAFRDIKSLRPLIHYKG